MVIFNKAKPPIVLKQDGWTPALVRGCLEGIGELRNDQASLIVWLEAEVSYIFVTQPSSDRISLGRSD
jgi:importin-5